MKTFFQDLDLKFPIKLLLQFLFFSAFWLVLIPCLTHNLLFSLQNSINLNLSSSVNSLRSSYEDILLYNKHKILCKYLLRTQAKRKSCFKSVFYGQKVKNAAKTPQENQIDFTLLQCFCSIFLLSKLNLLQCLMGGPRGSSDIHAQHSTFLLRVDEKWSSWLLSLKYTFET